MTLIAGMMLKLFYILFFLANSLLVIGQLNLQGEYVGQLNVSDTSYCEMHLSLNCDKTFSLHFQQVLAVGKWAITNHNTLKLKADYTKMGCFASKSNLIIKLLVEENKVILKRKPNKRISIEERHLAQSTEEKTSVTFNKNDKTTVLKKIKLLNCD